MPFTISHAAAALPFRHTRLVMSALVFGCVAPDLEYFLWLHPHGHFGHTIPGLFLFDLPAALIALLLFHRYAKRPLIGCLPIHVRERLRNGRTLPTGSVSRFALTCVSVMVGAATHLIWDSLTHSDYWLGQHWAFLRTTVHVPLFGLRPWAGVFQYISSALGLVVILVWFVRWYRDTPPVLMQKDQGTFSRDRIVVACAFVAAVLAGLVRAAIPGLPNGVHGAQRYMTDASITGIAVFCLEILVYGFLHSRFRSPSERA